MLRWAAASPGADGRASGAPRRARPPRRGCEASAVAASGAITAGRGSEAPRRDRPSASR